MLFLTGPPIQEKCILSDVSREARLEPMSDTLLWRGTPPLKRFLMNDCMAFT